jgi:hypothetical protein
VRVGEQGRGRLLVKCNAKLADMLAEAGVYCVRPGLGRRVGHWKVRRKNGL